ncbi:MAG TPA: hypothetical protein VIL18_09155 [Longimicrobiales bacterium]
MSERTMRRLPLLRPAAAMLLAATLLAVAAPARAAAQQAHVNIRPAVRTDGDFAFGARWDAGLEAERRDRPALSFPREAWWRLNGTGAWLSEAEANTEPVVRADGEAGLLLLLLKQRPCLPDDCPDDLVDLDLGYLTLAVRGQAELDQQAREGVLGLGAAVGYRPLGRTEGLWPLVPSLFAAYSAERPVMSELRDSAGVELEVNWRLDLDVLWHVRFTWDWVPAALQDLRLDVDLAHFRRHGVAEEAEGVVRRRGSYAAVDLGYELTGRVPYVRHAFVRWSRGEHPSQPERRRAWLVGVVVGSTR